MRTVKIAPSILAADFSRLGEEAAAAEKSGADLLHLDVMDGHFVRNITIGPAVVEAIRGCVKIPLDVHLMISEPDRFIGAFAEAGADIITVHAETVPHLHRTIEGIKSREKAAGVSINPSSPLGLIESALGEVDLALLMTVNPGLGGQGFISSVLPKVADLREIVDRDGLDLQIEVDGGINAETAGKVFNAGADILVAGTAVFRSPDMAAAINALRNAASG